MPPLTSIRCRPRHVDERRSDADTEPRRLGRNGLREPLLRLCEPVSRSEVEYQVDQGGERLAGCHFACFMAWQKESRAFNGSGGCTS